MARIKVIAKIDGGIHLKYGEIIKGKEYEIEEEHFGDQLFEIPPNPSGPQIGSPLTKGGDEQPASPPLAKGGRGGISDPATTNEGGK